MKSEIRVILMDDQSLILDAIAALLRAHGVEHGIKVVACAKNYHQVLEATAVPTLQPSPVRGHPTAVLNMVRRPPKNVAMLSLLSLSFDLPGPDTSKETEIRLHIWACWGGLLTVLNSVRCPCVEWNAVKPHFHPFRLVYKSHMLSSPSSPLLHLGLYIQVPTLQPTSLPTPQPSPVS